MKRYALIVALSLLLLALPMLANATRPEGHPRINALPGTKINLYPGKETETFSSSEETYVCHGWATLVDTPGFPGWSEMSHAQKVEFLKTATFTLTVDGDPVMLRRIQIYDRESDGMYVLWYATFDPGTFPVGSPVFFARWECIVDGELQVEENTVTIVVT